jgi:hypothetical protein
MAIHNEIRRCGIKILTSTRAAGITPAGVIGEYVGDEFSPAPLCQTIQKGILQSVITETKPAGPVAIGEKREYAADTVIYALGQAPLREEASALRRCASLFYQAGDCQESKNIYAANAAAYTIARDIGRY